MRSWTASCAWWACGAAVAVCGKAALASANAPLLLCLAQAAAGVLLRRDDRKDGGEADPEAGRALATRGASGALMLAFGLLYLAGIALHATAVSLGPAALTLAVEGAEPVTAALVAAATAAPGTRWGFGCCWQQVLALTAVCGGVAALAAPGGLAGASPAAALCAAGAAISTAACNAGMRAAGVQRVSALPALSAVAAVACLALLPLEAGTVRAAAAALRDRGAHGWATAAAPWCVAAVCHALRGRLLDGEPAAVPHALSGAAAVAVTAAAGAAAGPGVSAQVAAGTAAVLGGAAAYRAWRQQKRARHDREGATKAAPAEARFTTTALFLALAACVATSIATQPWAAELRLDRYPGPSRQELHDPPGQPDRQWPWSRDDMCGRGARERGLEPVCWELPGVPPAATPGPVPQPLPPDAERWPAVRVALYHYTALSTIHGDPHFGQQGASYALAAGVRAWHLARGERVLFSAHPLSLGPAPDPEARYAVMNAEGTIHCIGGPSPGGRDMACRSKEMRTDLESGLLLQVHNLVPSMQGGNKEGFYVVNALLMGGGSDKWRDALSKALGGVDALALRDYVSYRDSLAVARAAGSRRGLPVHFAADITLTLPYRFAPEVQAGFDTRYAAGGDGWHRGNDTTFRVVVTGSSTCPWKGGTCDSGAVLPALRELRDSHFPGRTLVVTLSLGHFPFHFQHYLDANDVVTRRMRTHSSAEVIYQMRQAHLVATGRFHAATLSYLAGTPAVALEGNTPKCQTLADLIGDRNLHVAKRTVEAVSEAGAHALDHRKELAELRRRRLPRLRTLAFRNIDAVYERRVENGLAPPGWRGAASALPDVVTAEELARQLRFTAMARQHENSRVVFDDTMEARPLF